MNLNNRQFQIPGLESPAAPDLPMDITPGQTWHHASETPVLGPQPRNDGMVGGGIHMGTEQAAVERTTEAVPYEGRYPNLTDVVGAHAVDYGSRPRPHMQEYRVKGDRYDRPVPDLGLDWPEESPTAATPYRNDAEDEGSTSLWATRDQVEHVRTRPNEGAVIFDGPTATAYLRAGDRPPIVQPRLPGIETSTRFKGIANREDAVAGRRIGWDYS